ncbi:MAG: S-layer homology domain-containing protein, partial [Oscillospiraceae bacterium]
MKKKLLSTLLAICMIITLLPVMAMAAPAFPDMPKDYSTTALENAVANGLLKGAEGKILPNANLKRAEMAAVTNRAFGAAKQADITKFKDVAATAWYFADMCRAVQMQTLKGDGVKLNPEAFITREQTFAVLARSLKLKDGTAAELSAFSDAGSVSTWAIGSTAAMIKSGFVHGADGKINPQAYISRKDFAVVMDNIIKNYITTAGEVTSVKDGTVMVNVPGVTLKNLNIKGDLIIGDGVGDGDITLDNVKVSGRTIVRGGGVNSVIVRGSSDLGSVTVSKMDGAVRVSVQGDAKVQVVYIDDGKDDVFIEG